MSLDDYSEIILAPKINNLAGNVAATIMSGVTVAQGAFAGTVVNGVNGGICNLVSNVRRVQQCHFSDFGDMAYGRRGAGQNSAQVRTVRSIADPFTHGPYGVQPVWLVQSGNGSQPPVPNARMYDALNFEWFMDQTTPLTRMVRFRLVERLMVQVADRLNLTVNAITGTLKIGDIITLPNVNAVNRVTKVSTGSARQFVVTADVANAGTTITVYLFVLRP